jgi:excisionase family DNA binding protein
VDEGDRRGVDRLTIQEAARRLGVSEGAVRKRVRRGSLQHDKAEDGRVYVYLDTGVDGGVDEGVDPNSNALISQLRDEVAYLRDENRRKDEIIMQQAMTMRQLTAAEPQEPTEAAERVEDELDTERARREMAESTLREGMAEEQRRREEAQRERDDLRRQLYALREPRQSSETGEEQQGRGQPRSDAPDTQEGVRRPWWQRWFGG